MKKQTYGECIDILASICRTISLATLSLCFPAAKLWQIDFVQEKPQHYVTYYLSIYSNTYYDLCQKSKAKEFSN